MYTTITKQYILYNENKEVIETFQSMEELIIYTKENLDCYIDYPIEEKTSIRNFW